VCKKTSFKELEETRTHRHREKKEDTNTFVFDRRRAQERKRKKKRERASEQKKSEKKDICVYTRIKKKNKKKFKLDKVLDDVQISFFFNYFLFRIPKRERKSENKNFGCFGLITVVDKSQDMR
jgi:hypothetical protein